MKRTLIKFLPIIILFIIPILSFAQETVGYTPLVGLPGVADSNGSGEVDFEKFINTLYYMSIGVAALLAVIKIVIAGVKYMLSDVVTTKGEAKNDIKGALIGLLVVMGAVLILTIINPQLANIDAEFDSTKTEIPEYVPQVNNQRFGPLGTMLPGDVPYPIPSTVLASSPAPEGLNDLEKAQWVCENQVLDEENKYCPLGQKNSQVAPNLPSQSLAYCYVGEWDAFGEKCVVRQADIKNFEESGGGVGGTKTVTESEFSSEMGSKELEPPPERPIDETASLCPAGTTEIPSAYKYPPRNGVVNPITGDYTDCEPNPDTYGTYGTGSNGVCPAGHDTIYDPAELIDPDTNTYGPTPAPRCVLSEGGSASGGGGYNTSCVAAACCNVGTIQSGARPGEPAVCVDSSGNVVGVPETSNNSGTGGVGTTNPCPPGQILDPSLNGLSLGGISCVNDPSLTQDEINGALFCAALGKRYSNGTCI